MHAKRIIPRELAEQDINDALTYYLDEGSSQAALGFINALEQAYHHISHNPASGSPRYAHELNLPDIRHWSLADYPYIVFYVEQHQRIDVWRVLHNQRDIPEFLGLNS